MFPLNNNLVKYRSDGDRFEIESTNNNHSILEKAHKLLILQNAGRFSKHPLAPHNDLTEMNFHFHLPSEHSLYNTVIVKNS